MRRIGIIAGLVLAASGAARAGVDLVVASETRTHREHITASPHTFTLRVDADDIRPFSKHAVVDDVLQWVSISGPAVNPRLEVDGMPDLRSAETILASVLRPGMTDYEKVLALHTVVARFSIYTSAPRTTWGLDDPVIALNSAAGICGNITVWTKSLAWKAGFPARTYEITTHTVPEIFYDGRWHMFDPTTWTFYIGRDNRSVASVRELEQALDVMKRAAAGARDLSWYETAHDNRLGGHLGQNGWRMDLRLRRGETLKRLTDHDGPSLWNHEISRAQNYATGFLDWTPDLVRDDLDAVLAERSNLVRDARGLRPERPDTPAVAVFRVASPHPITRATLKGRFGKASPDAKLRLLVTAYAPGMTTWTKEAFAPRDAGIAEHTVDLTPHVFGAFRYDVRFEMQSAKPDEPTGIDAVAFENALHINRYALPHLTGGANRITYRDDGPSPEALRPAGGPPPGGGDARDVTVVYNWREKHPLTVTPFPPMRGQVNRLKVAVTNRGDAPAENVELRVEQLWTRTPFEASAVIDRIDAGKTETAAIDWRPAGGRNVWVRVTVDPKNTIHETDETNNVFTRGMRLVSPPDLAMTPSQITLERRDARARLEALLINVGGLPARDVTVRFLTGDGKTGRVVGETVVDAVHTRYYTSESMSPYAWAVVEVDAAALTGTHLGVAVDPEGKLAERERGNNQAWATLADAERRAPAGDAALPPDPLVFVSFEPDCGELRDLESIDLADAREVPDHATHGKLAAKLIFPAKTTSMLRVVYDGDTPMPQRWDGCSRLRLDVFNASPHAASLVVRLRTLTDAGTVRYDTPFELPPGKPVALDVPLDRLDRADLAAVEKLELVVDRPTEPVTLFVDNFRLLKAERPAKLALLRGGRAEIVREAFPAARAVDATPVTLTRDDDLAHFPGLEHVVIADGFDSPTSKRGARFEIKRERSMGMTLELARDDAPWPADWSKYRRLSFQAKGEAQQPLAVSLKLRSSHPARGVRYVGRSFTVRTDGATHFIDLDEIRGRLDLDRMSRVTWFVWRPQFDGTLWLGNLRLEK